MVGLQLPSLFSYFPAIITGFLLGMQHAFEADHVVAVSTLVSQSKNFRRSLSLGLLWGLGHTFTLLLTGMLILILRLNIPRDIEIYFNYFVGIALIILGLLVIRSVALKKIHLHVHDHNGSRHIHLHDHSDFPDHHHHHRSFFIGALHGLAGSAAIMLIILSLLNTLWARFLYIIFFGVGTILGMVIFTVIFHLPVEFMSSRFPLMNKSITFATGVISIIFGIYNIVSNGS